MMEVMSDFDPDFIAEMMKFTESLKSVNIDPPRTPELSNLININSTRNITSSRKSSMRTHELVGSHMGSNLGANMNSYSAESEHMLDALAMSLHEKIPHSERGKRNYTEVLDISEGDNKGKFLQRVSDDYSKILYPPMLFTATVSGILRNYPVELSEKDLFDNLTPTGEIMELDCGQGCKRNPAYEQLLKENFIEKGKRGRPKKVKEKSNRKVPDGSSGDKMQSQLTFLFVSNERRKDKKTAHGYKEWKYLLFRKGKIHLAGLDASYIDESARNIGTIVDCLNNWLYPGVDKSIPENAEKMISLARLKLNNVNYKFFLKINEGQFIHHKSLEKIFRVIKAEDEGVLSPGNCKCTEKFCTSCKTRRLIKSMSEVVSDIKMRPLGKHPKICEVIPAKGNKLSIKIATPFPQKPNKYMRVEMFAASKIDDDYDKSGFNKIPPNTWGMRINVKGGLIFDGSGSENYVESTYRFLLEVFERYYDNVVRDITSIDDYEIEELYQDNIVQYRPYSDDAERVKKLIHDYEVQSRINDVLGAFTEEEKNKMGEAIGSWIARMKADLNKQFKFM